MLGNLQIEALTHRCAKCSNAFADKHLVLATYWVKSVRDFSLQVDIGIIGAGVRNAWVHFDCEKPLFTSWIMTPDLHSCIRCRKALNSADLVQPVFQVIDARAVNPLDHTDVGVALNDRVYFVHCDCTNPSLTKHSSNILVGI